MYVFLHKQKQSLVWKPCHLAGPPEKENEFYDIEEEGQPIHHSLQGTARQNHMVELECWEYAEVGIFLLKYHNNYPNYIDTSGLVNPCPAEPGYTLPFQTV